VPEENNKGLEQRSEAAFSAGRWASFKFVAKGSTSCFPVFERAKRNAIYANIQVETGEDNFEEQNANLKAVASSQNKGFCCGLPRFLFSSQRTSE